MYNTGQSVASEQLLITPDAEACGPPRESIVARQLNVCEDLCCLNTIDICDCVRAISTATQTPAGSEHFMPVTYLAEVAPRLWQSPHYLIFPQSQIGQLRC